MKIAKVLVVFSIVKYNMNKISTGLVITIFLFSSCGSNDLDCLNNLIVKIDDPIPSVLDKYQFEKTIGERKYGDYIFPSWSNSALDGADYFGLEMLGIKIDNNGKVDQINFIICCANEFWECKDFKTKSDRHIIKYFNCIPNLKSAIKSVNFDKELIFASKDYSVYSIDQEFERQIIIERN